MKRSAVRSGPHTYFSYIHMSLQCGWLNTVLRTTACWILYFWMNMWWDVMPVYCNPYQAWQGQSCILMSRLFCCNFAVVFPSLIAASTPNLVDLFIYFFSIPVLSKQRQTDYADKFSKDLLKQWLRRHWSKGALHWAQQSSCLRLYEVNCQPMYWISKWQQLYALQRPLQKNTFFFFLQW